jgi:hypothetical protein
MLFSYCILVTLKFAASRQTCCPARAKLGLKDWAFVIGHSGETFDMTIAEKTKNPLFILKVRFANF